ncbi:hypothetical protein MJH12_00560 [bacterium]|nr:hypothetical protein [bacterium]
MRKWDLINLGMIFLACFFLIGCGGGGGASFKAKTVTPILSCNKVNPVYSQLLPTDSILADDENTKVEILFDEDSNRQVCTTTGTAYINR